VWWPGRLDFFMVAINASGAYEYNLLNVAFLLPTFLKNFFTSLGRGHSIVLKV
jgi:hypothetical protein